MNKIYTERELMSMPLKIVRNLDIDTPDQEALVAKVVERRVSALPPSQPIYRKDIPDIQTPEQELEWQEVINKRMAKLRPALMEIDGLPKEEVPVLDPEAEDFDPGKVDLAPEEKENPVAPVSRESALQKRIREIETPVAGKPITLSGGVNSKLVRRTPTTKKK